MGTTAHTLPVSPGTSWDALSGLVAHESHHIPLSLRDKRIEVWCLCPSVAVLNPATQRLKAAGPWMAHLFLLTHPLLRALKWGGQGLLSNVRYVEVWADRQLSLCNADFLYLWVKHAHNKEHVIQRDYYMLFLETGPQQGFLMTGWMGKSRTVYLIFFFFFADYDLIFYLRGKLPLRFFSCWV